MTRHNKLRDGVADLSGKALTPLHMRDDPFAHPGCVILEGKSQYNTDSLSHQNKFPEKCLQMAENDK